MYRTSICALLFLMQQLCAIDNWEHLTSEQVNNDSRTLVLDIQQRVINGSELGSVPAEQIEALTSHQLDELGKYLTCYRKAIQFVHEHQGNALFWRHLISMRSELARCNHQKNEQGNYPSIYNRRRADIDNLNKLLQQELAMRGNIPHDPDPTHLLDPDSRYYAYRRMIDSDVDDGQGNSEICTIILSIITTGTTPFRVSAYDLEQVSLQELDTIKDQLAVYREAHHVAGDLCGDGVFWQTAWRMNHQLVLTANRQSDPSCSAYIIRRLKQCDALTSLVKERIALNAMLISSCMNMCRSDHSSGILSSDHKVHRCVALSFDDARGARVESQTIATTGRRFDARIIKR